MLLFVCWGHLYAQPGLEIDHLVDDVYVFTSYKNLNGKPFPSNGIYIVAKDGVVLIDTPWNPADLQLLLDSIANKHAKEVIMCLATHSHDDRTAGLAYYKNKGIKTFTTRLTDSISVLNNEKRAEFLIESDTMFTIGKYTIQTYYPGKGHTADNIVVWLNRSKVLYGGCFVKSTQANGLGNLNDVYIDSWPVSLKAVIRSFRKPDYIIPGHFGWYSTKALKHTLKLIKAHKK